jgi:hypothetical protein
MGKAFRWVVAVFRRSGGKARRDLRGIARLTVRVDAAYGGQMGVKAFLRLRMAVLAVLTVALVATGWAHRAPAPSGDVLALMAATGATAADFCGDVGSAGRHGDALCQACQISGGAGLPPLVAALAQLGLTPAPVLVHPGASGVIARVLDLSRAPQGPPVA